jgi:hypothetical protein
VQKKPSTLLIIQTDSFADFNPCQNTKGKNETSANPDTKNQTSAFDYYNIWGVWGWGVAPESQKSVLVQKLAYESKFDPQNI